MNSLEEVREWLCAFLDMEYEAASLMYKHEDEIRCQTLSDQLSSMYAYADPNVPRPQDFIDSDELIKAKKRILSQLRSRPIFQLKLYKHRAMGEYVRAYVGSDRTSWAEYDILLLIKKTEEGVYQIISSSNACGMCGGLGVLPDGEKDSECNGLGWHFRKEGKRPPKPPGQLIETVKLQRPLEPPYTTEYDLD